MEFQNFILLILVKDYLQNPTKIIEAPNAVIEDYQGVFNKK